MRISTAVRLGAGGLWVLVASGAAAQLQPCPDESHCFRIAVGSPPDPTFRGGIVDIPIDVRPAQGDGVAGGPDEISAVSLTLSIPGLELADCSAPDQNGLNPSFSVPSAVADQFLVFIDNTSCGGRGRCLCPGKGEARDDFINIAVSGPRDIHQTVIPTLAEGELLRVTLRVRDDAADDLRLHVFTETDDPKTTPKPEFSGYVTLGDNQAVDVTADRKANVSRVQVVDGEVVVSGDITPTVAPPTEGPTGSPTAATGDTPTVTPTAEATESPVVTPPTGCPGDCDGNGVVSIDELIRGVDVALGRVPPDECTAADEDGDGTVAIDELVRAVNAAMSRCGE